MGVGFKESRIDNAIWQAAFNSVEDIIFILKTDLSIVAMNRKGRRFFSLQDFKSESQKCYEVLHKRNSHCEICPIVYKLEGKQMPQEHIIETWGRLFQVQSTPIRGVHGKETMYVYILRDITDQRSKENDLKEMNEEMASLNEEYLSAIEELQEKNKLIVDSENRYHMLFENMSSAFAYHKVILDDNGKPVDYRFIECNPMFEKLTGLKRDHIIGKTVKNVMPNVEQHWIDTFGSVAMNKETIEYQNYAQELKKHYSVKVFSPLKEYFAVTFHDITDQVQAQEILKLQNEELNEHFERIKSINDKLESANNNIVEKEQLLNAIFNSAPVVMMLLNEHKEIIQINETGLELTGHDKNTKGLKPGDFYYCINALSNPDGCGSGERCNDCKLRQTIEHTLLTGESKFKIESEVNIYENDKEVTKTILISTSKIKKNVLVTIDDITSSKQTENELRQAKNKAVESDRLKTSFLANMSHEIRTPLNGILGFTNLLATRDNMTSEQIKSFGSIIQKSSDELLRIIDDIIEVSKIESGNLEIIEDTFNVNEMLSELYTVYSKVLLAEGKNIELIKKGSNAPLFLRSDEKRIRQIFNNLLSNAVKFTEEGNIEFGIHQIHDRKIVFFVKDTGIGIPEDQHEVIFDRFRQCEDSFERVYGGNGLGLAIVKDIIGLLKGNVWFESSVQEGSCFYFEIPRNQGELSPIESVEVKSPEKISGNTNYRILVVEDNDINRYYIKEILESTDAQIVTATSGKEAIDRYKTNKFDIILMDIRLPEMNGYEVVKKIRETDSNVYIIAQTAYAMHSDREKALQAGCNDYISKPINKDELLRKITAI